MNQEMGSKSAGTPGEEKPTMNALQRFFGLFFSPVRAFQDINRKPSFILPLVVMIIFSLAATSIVMPKIDWEATMQKSLERAGREMSGEEIEKVIPIQRSVGTIIGYVAAFIAPVLTALVVSGIFFGIVRLWGAGSSFSRVFGVVTHSYLVGLIKTVLMGVVALRQESIIADDIKYFVKSNLTILLNKEEVSLALYTLASKIDLFSIWTVILLIIGLSAVSKLGMKQSAASVLITWLVYIAVSTAWVAMMTALFHIK
ncbi:MAG: Yip1 family protein [Acidobacteriota bacterium]